MSRDFDGVDDLINCGTAGLDNKAPFTVACHCFPDTQGEANVGRFVDKGSATTGWQFHISATNRVRFNHAYTGATPTDLELSSVNNSIVLDKWQFVAMTWDGSPTATNAHLYVDGQETAYAVTTDAVGTKGDDAALPFLIGNSIAAARTFDGALAHVMFYGKVLTPGEMRQIRFFPASITDRLLGYWPLRGISSPEPDYSGLGNHGLLTGTLKWNTDPAVFGVWHPRRRSRFPYTAPASVPATPSVATPTTRRKSRALVGVGL